MAVSGKDWCGMVQERSIKSVTGRKRKNGRSRFLGELFGLIAGVLQIFRDGFLRNIAELVINKLHYVL